MIIVGFVLLLVVFIVGLYIIYSPTIDIIPSKNNTRILLWYNTFDGDTKIRKFIILYKHEKR